MKTLELFDKNGNQHALVKVTLLENERYPDIVMWNGRYYAFTQGRYVEATCVAGQTP